MAEVEEGRFVRLVYARIAANEDLAAAVEKVCLDQGIGHGFVRGSLGSLTDAVLLGAGERRIELRGPAIEVLSLTGEVRSEADGVPRATLAGVVADALGRIHAGRFAPGLNPVCVTFELALEVWEPAAAPAASASSGSNVLR